MKFLNSSPGWTRAACAIVLVFLLSGCAGVQEITPISGAKTYCLREMPNDEFRKNLKESHVRYGSYNRGKIGGDSSICDLNRFYILTIKWETKDGQQENLDFDLAEIMKDFQQRVPEVNRTFRLYGRPQIQIRYFIDRLDIVLRVAEYQEGGVVDEFRLIKPLVISEFEILTMALPSKVVPQK